MFRQLNFLRILSYLWRGTKGLIGGESTKKNILILKTDALGDWVLFSRFLSSLIQEMKDTHFTIVGDVGIVPWMKAMIAHDRLEIISIHNKKFKTSLSERNVWIKEVFTQRYFSEIWVCNSSRDLYISDYIIGHIQGGIKKGPTNDGVLIASIWSALTDANYTKLYSRGGGHELYRIQHYLEQLTGSNLLIENQNPLEQSISDKYVFIAPGAGHSSRCWSPEKYIQVAQWLKSYDIQVCWAGSKAEAPLLQKCQLNSNHGLVLQNASPTEVIQHMKRAACWLGNDSGLLHLAVSLSVPTICISNGNHYGRFVPYPPELSKAHHACVFPPDFEQLGDEEKKERTKNKSSFSIHDIDILPVIRELAFALRLTP